MNAHEAKLLREPFPSHEIGQLPKGGVLLDYVGHAAVTNRLLQVDPGWTWEPFGYDARGLPALDDDGNLWIRLTVCGLTRPGVGDGKNMKERISDAIRNAAMRFGVALDLWAKEDLTAGEEEPPAKTRRRRQTAAGAVATELEPSPAAEPEAEPEPPPPMTDPQRRKMHALFRETGFAERPERLGYVEMITQRSMESSSELTREEAARVIDGLEAIVAGR